MCYVDKLLQLDETSMPTDRIEFIHVQFKLADEGAHLYVRIHMQVYIYVCNTLASVVSHKSMFLLYILIGLLGRSTIYQFSIK